MESVVVEVQVAGSVVPTFHTFALTVVGLVPVASVRTCSASPAFRVSPVDTVVSTVVVRCSCSWTPPVGDTMMRDL